MAGNNQRPTRAKRATQQSIIVSVAEETGPCSCQVQDLETYALPVPVTPTEILLTLIFQALDKMEKAPEGLIFCIPEKSIEGEPVVEYDIEKEPDAGESAWFSCNILNDGTNEVYVRFNRDHGEFRRIKKSEDLTIDLHGPKIRKLYFKCAAAESATVRIIGVR